jgi:hypothetical protein
MLCRCYIANVLYDILPPLRAVPGGIGVPGGMSGGGYARAVDGFPVIHGVIGALAILKPLCDLLRLGNEVIRLPSLHLLRGDRDIPEQLRE